MTKEIRKLVTRHNQNVITGPEGITASYEFTLYRTFINFYVPPFRSRYGKIQGLVELEAYGLIIRRTLQLDEEIEFNEVDLGALSAQQYEVNALMHKLARLNESNSKSISHAVNEMKETWNKNEWGNPFGKHAERELIRNYRQDQDIVIPPLMPLSSLQTRQSKLAQVRNSLKNFIVQD